MKRPGKCIGKVPFSDKRLAIASAEKHYRLHGKKYGVYECPSCLEFHLTSKYCNLTHLHQHWGETPEQKAQRARENKRLRKQRNRMRRTIRKRIKNALTKLKTTCRVPVENSK